MMNRRSTRILAVAVIMVMAGVLIGFFRQHGRHTQPGAKRAAAHAAVVEYLNALEERDRERILKLVPAGYDAAKDIDERLQRFGGAHAAEARIDITMDLSPEVLSAAIRTVGPEGQSLVWIENLFWRDEAWWLVLGGRPSPLPVSDIHRPEP